MTRSIRRLQWCELIIAALLMMPGGPPSAWAQNTFPASGNVGIGTTAPGATLDVRTSGGTIPRILDLRNTGTGGGEFTVNLAGGSIGSAVAGDSLITNGVGHMLISPNAATKDIKFIGGTWTNAVSLIIKDGGNVGIGTTTPGAKLHVAGDVQVDGNLAAKYQDVAEWVQAPLPLSPGNVVVIDPQGHNQVLPASQPYDTRVAGVVSSRPGLLLGEAGEGKVKVAHSGRVKVKVDTSYGPIAVGDLLVTSPTVGHAMRSIPLELGGTRIHRPGTLLGKALESLETGQGEILVLLTLQ